MKPRRLIEAEESADELHAIVRQLVADELARVTEPRFLEIETARDRDRVVALRHNERLSSVEHRLDMDVPDTVSAGQTVKAFAKRVHRSPETIRKLIRQGRIGFERLGTRVIIAADATLPPRRRKSTFRPA